MKKVLLAALASTLLSTGLAYGQIYVRVGPPPPVYEQRLPPPGPGYEWVDGYHRWDGHRYIWVHGYWAHPPREHAHWVHGHWDRRPGGWIWIEGHWRY
jgi:WXXGXW repeat (2 copies)